MSYKNLIDWDAFAREEAEIEALTDRMEAAERERLLDELQLMVWKYNERVNSYNYVWHCIEIEARGLVFKPIAKQTAEQKWDAFFASQLTPEEKQKCYYSDFKWHMFSFEKVAALKGEEANRAFDACERGEAYLFIQCTDEAWRIENAQLLTAADLCVDYDFQRADVYIFDAAGTWAYARTHESDCGPYFLRKTDTL